jgi:hypothetical protein
MQIILKSIVILVILLCGNFARAVCELAEKDNTTYCSINSSGACCVIEIYSHNQKCYEVWCYEYDQCSWRQDAAAECT